MNFQRFFGPHLRLVGMALLWGASWPAGRVVAQNMPPLAAASLRFLLAAAVLARTERLRVGTSVLVLPLHHPLMLAEEIAQLDLQSAGRIDVGVGRGTEPAAL
ncbi:LLM class flavin-dependent oxidoreductase, partial [Glaesserella parasuis]|uniref:LLM class flavin-dependent oxidoreductase n=1 Tax=Glaesserella parasuis TaxID=738 RepID=UPI003B68337E